MKIYSDEQIVSRTSGFVFKEMGNESVIIELVNNVVNMDKVLTLNDLGTFIYTQLKEEKSIEELLTLILTEFDVDRTTAIVDLEEFLKEAEKMKIISISK